MMPFPVYLLKVLLLNRGLSGLAIRQHLKTYLEWRALQESGESPVELGLPWITVSAKSFIERYLKGRPKCDRRVFEYGTGGSSLFFRRLAAEVVSVEHDRSWFEYLRLHVGPSDQQGWRVNLIEPEPVEQASQSCDWQDPRAYRSADSAFSNFTFRAYASFIEKFPRGHFDVVLVDGRSRPSCLAHAALHVKSGGLLVLDNAERRYYLVGGAINPEQFALAHSCFGGLIASPGFTQTNVYIRK